MASEVQSEPENAGPEDPILFGWDPSPGIVSVWADRDGLALVWRRVDGAVVLERQRFRPWLLAHDLVDLEPLGAALAEEGSPAAARALVTYRRLEGPDPAYRFLLSAARWRPMERAILAGAGARLGSRPDSLRALERYLGLGPVEQYLTLSGRTCFRGLRYEDLHRLQLDLETTDLSPESGRIFMAALSDSRGWSEVLEAPVEEDEAKLIEALCARVRGRDPDVIENHNLIGFDLPFLEARAALLGVRLAIGRQGGPPLLQRQGELPAGASGRRRRDPRYTVAGRELIDTLEAVRRHDFVARDLQGHGLKEVARHFGVASPGRTYLPGARIFATYQADPATVRAYALDDVAEVAALSRRLMGAPFALAGMAPRRYERVAAAGPATGILEPILLRAYLRAGAAPPFAASRAEADLDDHTGGATVLYAAGLARRVVKVDIASMYPSIMRQYRIGPATDPLGALLHVVGRMTELRLRHKDALRSAAAGSLERGYHDAMQAAMKLLINSAYGYMAAGSLALFADRRAADAVTARGRALLIDLAETLRRRGMLLLEADTDGIYFATPPGWTEPMERALVAELDAALPAGIRLEYEGRYRAMLSHEVKNYALLTAEGRLIVRGGALRSSRSEPYGERFLQQALACLLRDDVAGVHRAFQATLAALRARHLPSADLAMRVRLTKSMERYQAGRDRLKEGPYEALLAAGRAWRPGERIRWYRAQGGRPRWLGESDSSAGSAETLPDARDYDIEHYVQTLVGSYADRLRKAFSAEDFGQLFRSDLQAGLFDRPIDDIRAAWLNEAADGDHG